MISVVYCTRKTSPEHQTHLRKSSGIKDIEIIEIINNGESLTKCYNRGLKQTKNDIVVFCHDDIFFNKNGWGKKLINHFHESDYGILGIAGTTHLPESGQWWEDPTKMVGEVKHSWEGKTWKNQYSGCFPNEIIDTVIVDGLFFAVDKTRIKKKFDTKVEGFHFYEIDFCLRNRIEGVKIGVIFDVKLTHKSIGQTNDSWEENRKIFAEKYKDNLPFNLDVKPFIDEITPNYNQTPKLKIIVSTTGKKKHLNKILKQIESLQYSNASIDVIVNAKDKDKFEDFNVDGVTLHEGMYDTLGKNLSVLRWDDEFISTEDELVLFLSADVDIKNNILVGFVKTYLKNKNNFGAIFPRTLNEDNSILSCGTNIFVLVRGDKQLVDFKYSGGNSYYKYNEGVQNEDLGGIGKCFMTTRANLEKYVWFKLNYEKSFYETEFALQCSNDRKRVFVDNNSVVRLRKSFIQRDNPQLNEDFKSLMGVFQENKDYMKFIKVIQQK